MMDATPIYLERRNEADRLFASPIISANTEQIPNWKRDDSVYYYLVTETGINHSEFESNTIKFSDFTLSSTNNISQLELINYASYIFGDSKPLEGKPLEVLKNTARRVLSKVPTSFPRK